VRNLSLLTISPTNPLDPIAFTIIRKWAQMKSKKYHLLFTLEHSFVRHSFINLSYNIIMHVIILFNFIDKSPCKFRKFEKLDHWKKLN
jgi:hypothetical protein